MRPRVAAAPRIAPVGFADGRPDLNRGPHRPERCALPGCATPRVRRRLSQRTSRGDRPRDDTQALSILGRDSLGAPPLALLRPRWRRPGAPAFVGMARRRGRPASSDYELMESSGVKSVRLPMYWTGIQPETPARRRARLRRLRPRGRTGRRTRDPDHALRLGPPEWAAARDRSTCRSRRAWQRWAWATFLRDAVDRYGPDGSFWHENPDLPYLPIRTLGDLERGEHRHLLRLDRPRRVREAAARSPAGSCTADPGARVLVGGLFGRPLQIPPNIGLRRLPLPALPGAATSSATSTASPCTPTSPTPARCGPRSATCGGSCALHHDARTPLYVTEPVLGGICRDVRRARRAGRWHRGSLCRTRPERRSSFA